MKKMRDQVKSKLKDNNLWNFRNKTVPIRQSTGRCIISVIPARVDAKLGVSNGLFFLVEYLCNVQTEEAQHEKYIQLEFP